MRHIVRGKGISTTVFEGVGEGKKRRVRKRLMTVDGIERGDICLKI